jgi:Transport protein Avl9
MVEPPKPVQTDFRAKRITLILLFASELFNRPVDVTRSTIQKSIVVLARKPVFGPIREKLGVVTRAWFLQRDFEVQTPPPPFASGR